MKYHKILKILAAFVILVSFHVARGEASSIREVSLDEMIKQSQFIFDGTVISLEAKRKPTEAHSYLCDL